MWPARRTRRRLEVHLRRGDQGIRPADPFRTAPGAKLVHVAVNEQVALQADDVRAEEVWSVVAKGTARILDRQSEVDAAERLSLRPMLPALKYTFVEITPTETTGIRFVPGPEPERF